MKKTKIIKAVCSSCDGTGIYGTGIYCGFAEAKGEGVVCLGCIGTGCMKISYAPFAKRKLRKDVQFVFRSRGTSIVVGVGPAGASVTYKEFCAGKMPRTH